LCHIIALSGLSTPLAGGALRRYTRP
jgi:hypothetical protein